MSPKTFLNRLVTLCWMVTVFVWPVMKWILSLNVLMHFIWMLMSWKDKGFYALLVFLFYFMILVFFTYFVESFKPEKT